MMRTTALQGGLLALMLVCAAAVAAEEEPGYWLERMVGAAHELNYEGRFIYMHQGTVQAMRIVHGVGEEGEHERLITLNGPSREVIRVGGTVTCILPDDNAVVVDSSRPSRPFPITLPTRLEALEDYYRVEMAGQARVAGLATRRIDIHPRDDYRYGHRFWIDEESGLLLRSELVDDGGRVVERLLFTSIQLYDELPEAQLKAETAGADLLWYKKAEAGEDLAADVAWRVTRLPPGFEQDMHRKHYMPSIEDPVDHMVFTDGLASISVFIEPRRPQGRAFEGLSSMGAVNAYARNLNGHRVTVVGEVPPQAVRLVARSVDHAADAEGDR